MGKNDVFIGFDADPRNLELARKELENLQTQTQIILIHANFSELRAKLSEHGIEKITGIYYDLGMSSLHFDEASRGFSFRQEGPLDMRLNPEIKGTAHDILLKASE